MFHAPAFLHGHSQQIAVFVLSLAVAVFATAWDFSSIRHGANASRSEATFLMPSGFGSPSMGSGVKSALADSVSRRRPRIVDFAVRLAKGRLATAQRDIELADRAIEVDEFDLAAKSIEAQRLQGLWSQGAVPTAARDVAVGALERLMSALGRDRALKSVAERQVELAAADVESMKAGAGRPLEP